MPNHYTDEQKKNRKKGGMRVQGESVEKYRKMHNKRRLEIEMKKLREEFKNK